MIKDCMKKKVISIQAESTLLDAANKMVEHHIGFLPVVDRDNIMIGILGLPDLLAYEMPAFFNLISDIDFIGDFGAVETMRPNFKQINQPVTAIMRPALSVTEESGLILAYGLMFKHNLTDLPVISEDGKLTGIVSRVDIGTMILHSWKEIREHHP